MRRTALLLLAIVLTVGAAQSQEKYQRKSGLWEVTRSSTRTEDQQRAYQLCVEQASDNALRQLAGGMRSETCETSKVIRDGDKVIIDATCKGTRTSTATTHAVITGRFDSAYKIESTSTFDPPVRGKAEGTAVIKAKWTGACKPDQRPGDIILPNGARIRAGADDKPGAATDRVPPDKGDKKKRGGGAYVPGPVPSTK